MGNLSFCKLSYQEIHVLKLVARVSLCHICAPCAYLFETEFTSRARQEAGTSNEGRLCHPLPHGRGSFDSKLYWLRHCRVKMRNPRNLPSQFTIPAASTM